MEKEEEMEDEEVKGFKEDSGSVVGGDAKSFDVGKERNEEDGDESDSDDSDKGWKADRNEGLVSSE